MRNPRTAVARRVAVSLATVGLAAATTFAGSADPARADRALLPPEAHTDIAYTEPVPETTQGNLLDIYLPARRADKPLPLFIYTEGSAWFADTGKSSGAAWAERLNPYGFAVAGVSVRSSSQTQFPGQLHDIKAAIRYLRANADTYGLDPDRFAIGGFSSGAWTAAIAGTANNVGPDLEGTTGVTGVSSEVQAVVTFAPPTAFRLMDSQATEYSVLEHSVPSSPESILTGCTGYPTGIGDPACTSADLANPLNYVTPDDPPFLMFHGTHDQLLPPGQSEVLFEALAENCVAAEFHLVDGPDHTYDYIDAPGEAPVVGQVVNQVDRHSCRTRSFDGLRPGTVPSVDLVARFLYRSMGVEAKARP
ncbi:alpha/beta hydrolase fold domain-containing protein [Nocardioides sp. NPDC051685]|uniref:alpha/beta hydrolase fold domain-containing protein n=1 Tax=Nocardioides sp. NPDC051685 TaxID=3364334 RepID=UPI0037ABFE2C